MNWITAIWSWLTEIDPRIWQAFVAGLFIASGWLVNGWQNRKEAAQQAQQTRDDASALRAERLRDVHRALYAEIGANLSNLESNEVLFGQRDATLSMMQQNPDYVPFLGRENRDLVFKAIVSEIHVLPRTSIDAVVSYYAQLAAIDAMTDDLRGPTYASLSVSRRMDIYSDYMGLKVQAMANGKHALAMINAYSKGGSAAAHKLETELKRETLSSHPGADPSGQ